MVKRVVVLLFVLISFIKADIVDEKIKNLIGKKNYLIQKKFLDVVFKNKGSFYRGSTPDVVKIVNILKKNNLIKLYFEKPREFKIKFSSVGYPLAFIKAVSDSLYSMGYSYFLTNKAQKSGDNFDWIISINTEYAIDPSFFSKELEKRGCYIEDIKRFSDTKWQYNINMVNVEIVSKNIELNSETRLKKPIDPYWINIANASSITLKSQPSDNWYPYIVFYDQYLNIIDNYTQEEKRYNVKLEIPANAKYAKITDMYTLDNIKRGLSVYLSE